MPTFTYRALDEDGKETQGSIDAADEASARSALVDLHLEPVEVREAMRLRRPKKKTPAEQPAAVPPASAGPEMITFTFEGKDANGTSRRGSVQAETKEKAFAQLHRDQGLTLSILSPVGMPVPLQDEDLTEWQNVPVFVAATPPPTVPFTVIEPVSDSTEIPVQNKVATETIKDEKDTQQKTKPIRSYASIFSTMRLYAGWLLTWYALFVSFGYYKNARELPVDIPGVEAFFFSPLIFTFILAIFLYLLLHSIQRALKGEVIVGTFLTIVGIAMFFVLRMSIV